MSTAILPVESSAGTSMPPAKRAKRPRVKSTGWQQIAIWVVLGIFAVFTITPFLITFVLALSPEGELTIPHQLPDSLTLDNIVKALTSRDIGTWIINSTIYAGVSTVIVLLIACMAGYAFARKKFFGSEVMLWAFLATLMVPTQATLIPQFILVSEMKGIDTLWGMLVPTLANSQAVFLMRQFIIALPNEIFEAARIDGAGEWRVFTRIVLPLTKPVMATLGIFVFLWHWNDFLWPLIVSQSRATQTLTVGLATLNAESVSLQALMASAAITVIPCLVIFAVLQRYLVSGISMGAVKG